MEANEEVLLDPRRDYRGELLTIQDRITQWPIDELARWIRTYPDLIEYASEPMAGARLFCAPATFHARKNRSAVRRVERVLRAFASEPSIYRDSVDVCVQYSFFISLALSIPPLPTPPVADRRPKDSDEISAVSLRKLVNRGQLSKAKKKRKKQGNGSV